MSISEILGVMLAMVSISGFIGYFVYDNLQKMFLADKTEKHSHRMALSGRMSALEKSLYKLDQELTSKLDMIDESSAHMLKTMLDSEEKYAELQNDEIFSLKSTLESLGETVKSLQSQLDKKKLVKSVKKTGKRK